MKQSDRLQHAIWPPEEHVRAIQYMQSSPVQSTEQLTEQRYLPYIPWPLDGRE